MSLPRVCVGGWGRLPGDGGESQPAEPGPCCLHRTLRPALSPTGCSCDPRGTLGGAAQCQLVSLRAKVLGVMGQAQGDPRPPNPTFS